MNKKEYEKAVLEIYIVDNCDAIVTSAETDGGNGVEEPIETGGGIW